MTYPMIEKKFINYLINEKKIKSNYETILKIVKSLLNETSDNNRSLPTHKFSDPDDLEKLDIYFDPNEKNSDNNLIKTIKYLTVDEVKVLAEISTEIGFSVASFQALVKLIPMTLSDYNDDNDLTENSEELKNNNEEKPLLKKFDELIKSRKETHEKLESQRKKINKIEISLKIYDKIKEILDFKNSRNECHYELISHREFIKSKKILENTFVMKKLPNKLESLNENPNDDNLNIDKDLASLPKLTSLVVKPDYDITDDFEFDNLNEIDPTKHKRRMITIDKLKATTDEVINFRYWS